MNKNKDKKCRHAECDRTAAYGHKGGPRLYCSNHAPSDTINLKGFYPIMFLCHPDCETARMINISQSLGMKTIFIRYDPDDYKVNGKKQNITLNKRLKDLQVVLLKMMEKKAEELDFLSVIYLFYDEYDYKKLELKTILKSEEEDPKN